MAIVSPICNVTEVKDAPARRIELAELTVTSLARHAPATA